MKKRHICRQNINIHKTNLFLKKKENRGLPAVGTQNEDPHRNHRVISKLENRASLEMVLVAEGEAGLFALGLDRMGVGLSGELGALSPIQGCLQEGCKIKLPLPVGTANTYALWEQIIPHSFLGRTPPNGCPASLVLKVVVTDFAPLLALVLASVKWV